MAKLFYNPNPNFGHEGPYEGENELEASHEMDELFTEWAETKRDVLINKWLASYEGQELDEDKDIPSIAKLIEEMRAEFIRGLEEWDGERGLEKLEYE